MVPLPHKLAASTTQPTQPAACSFSSLQLCCRHNTLALLVVLLPALALFQLLLLLLYVLLHQQSAVLGCYCRHFHRRSCVLKGVVVTQAWSKQEGRKLLRRVEPSKGGKAGGGGWVGRESGQEQSNQSQADKHTSTQAWVRDQRNRGRGVGQSSDQLSCWLFAQTSLVACKTRRKQFTLQY